MTPVRRSSRRIKKEPPEMTNMKKPLTRATRSSSVKEPEINTKLRTRKATEELKKTEDEETQFRGTKSPKIDPSQETGAEGENQRPRTRQMTKKKDEDEEMTKPADAETERITEEGERSRSKTRSRTTKIVTSTPVSTRDKTRPALRDVHQVPDPFQKQHTVVTKTGSFTETFPGRLAWKKKHYDKPVTSTPVPPKQPPPADPKEQLEKDVNDLFGFHSDDEPEEILDYSTLISPIAKVKDKKPVTNVILYKKVPQPVEEEEEHKADFNELLHKYHPELEKGEDEICFNPQAVKATYGNKHKVVKLPVVPVTRRSARSSTKSISLKTISKQSQKIPISSKGRAKKRREDELDLEAQKWLEEKNKEFEEIDKVPLLIEQSFEAPEQECGDAT